MKKRLFYLLLSLSLCSAPARAQPGKAEEVQFVVRCLSSANQQQVENLVKADRPLARRAFELTLKEMLETKPEGRDPRFFGLMWLWARALADPALEQRLKSAQIPDQPVAFVEPYIMPLGSAQMLIGMGNFRQAETLLTALEKTLPFDADKQRLMLTESRLVGGRPLLARQQGEALVELARKQPNPEELLVLYVCLLDAARMGGLPDVTNRYLEPLKQAIATLPPKDQPFWRFYARSFEELRQLEREPETNPVELCRRHDAVWAELKDQNPFITPVLGRVFTHLAGRWLERLTDFPEADPATDQAMETSAKLELDQIRSISTTLGDQQNRQSEVYQARMALITLVNDVHQYALRAQNIVASRKLIVDMMATEKHLIAIEPQAQELQRDMTPVLVASLPGLPRSFSFSLLDGDWNRQRSRIRMAEVQQLTVDPPPKLSQQKLLQAKSELVAEALELNESALRGSGYQAETDARWAVIEYDLKSRPPGWQKEADRLLNQLVEVNRSLGYREGLARAQMLRGRLQADLGQEAAAMASLRQAVETVESYLSEVEAGAAGARVLRQRYRTAYDLLTRLQVKNGQIDGAFQTADRQIQAWAVQHNQDSLRQNANLREVQRVKTDTAALERQLAEERQQGADTRASEQLLASTKGEYQRVVADLRRQHPQYEGAMAIRPVEFLSLRKSIPADATVILYFLSDEGLYIFVASQKDELKIRKVPVPRKDLENCVLRVRQLIGSFPSDPALSKNPESFSWTDPGSPGYQRHSLPLKTELARLHKWLIEPVQADLGERPVLALVPTGTLHYVPFPALCTVDSAGKPGFLAERRLCVNLVKTSDLMPMAAAAGKQLFAVGNPDGTLPGAEREVASIAASFPGSQKVIGSEATVARLQKLAPGTGYVHLATHGQLSETDPKNSYLVMAGPGASAHFRATDIYDLDWPGVRLVTLSACETALQEGQPGAAITSLAEAFRVAGGQAVVASLWSVEDNATEKLMVEFYKQLAQGKSLAASLQTAELTISRDPRFKHPFFWSAFTLLGDWR